MDRSSKETMCARKGKPARSKEEETASLRVAKELQRSLNGLRGSTRTSKKAKVVEKAVKRPAKSQKGKSRIPGSVVQSQLSVGSNRSQVRILTSRVQRNKSNRGTMRRIERLTFEN